MAPVCGCAGCIEERGYIFLALFGWGTQIQSSYDWMHARAHAGSTNPVPRDTADSPRPGHAGE
jgi:hypothetical protein